MPPRRAWRSPRPPPPPDYYAGKSIEIVVGARRRRRLRHLCAHGGAAYRPHIPGNPTVLVKNMPGAGWRAPPATSPPSRPRTAPRSPPSCRARSWTRCWSKAPRRCSIRPRCNISAPPTTAPRLHHQCGERDQDVRRCAERARPDRRRPRPTIRRATTPSCTQHLSNAKFEVVPATRARSTSALAIERNEVDGACGWDWSSIKAQKPDWITRPQGARAGAGRRSSRIRNSRKMGVPSFVKFVKTDEDRKVGELIVSQQVITAPTSRRRKRRRSSSASCARPSTPP